MSAPRVYQATAARWRDAAPAIPAEYRAALVALARSYADLLLPTERRALWSMYGLPALRAVDRLRLSVLASAARDRNEGRDDE